MTPETSCLSANFDLIAESIRKTTFRGERCLHYSCPFGICRKSSVPETEGGPHKDHQGMSAKLDPMADPVVGRPLKSHLEAHDNYLDHMYGVNEYGG